MSNPVIEAWNRRPQNQELQLPPIGVVDQEETNPAVRAWNTVGPGRGRSLLASLPIGQGALLHPLDQAAAVLGVAGSAAYGILKPFAALAGFPGAVGRSLGLLEETDQMVTDRAGRLLSNLALGIRDRFEAPAMERGYSEAEVRSARMLGEMIGYTAPGAGLYKVTGRALGVATSGVSAVPFMAGLKVDVVSGMVWGGVLTEGEMSDRFKNAAFDGGLSGGIGLALGGVWPALANYRSLRVHNRQIDNLHAAEKVALLKKYYDFSPEGIISIDNAAQGRGLFDLMAEESLFINSPETQRILRQNANEVALISAMTDVAGARANAGIVKQVSGDITEVSPITDKFRAAFPGVKFQEVKNPEGGFDIFFGSKGLNSTQRQQYSKEGRYAGQRLTRSDGTYYEYVGLAEKPGYINVIRIGEAPAASVAVAPTPVPAVRTTLPTELAGAKPRYNYGMKEFELQFESDIDRALMIVAQEKKSRRDDSYMGWLRGQFPGISDSQIRQMGKHVRASIKDIAKDAEPGTIRVPSAFDQQAIQAKAAITPVSTPTTAAPKKANVRAMKASGFTDLAYGIEPDLRFPEEDALFQSFDDYFRGNAAKVLNERYQFNEGQLVTLAREGRLTEEILGRRRIREPNAITQREETGLVRLYRGQITQLDPSQQTQSRWFTSDKQIAELYAMTESAGGKIQTDIYYIDVPADVAHQVGGFGEMGGGDAFMTPEWVARMRPVRELETDIRLNGTENVWELHPWESIDFEDTVRLWAEQQGLPTSGPEFTSLQAHFGAKMRDKLIKQWEADFPQESAVLKGMQDEWNAIIEAEGMPIRARAAVKGFHYEDSAIGPRIRDINTGVVYQFKTLDDLEAALVKVARGDKDIGGGILPPDVIQHVASPNAVEHRPMREFIPDALPANTLSQAVQQDLPTKFDKPTVNFLKLVEERTGIPVWSLGFNVIDEAATTVTRDLEPWMRDLDNMWATHGIKNRKDALRIGDYLMATEGSPMTPTQRFAKAKEMGLSQEDLRAVKELRRTIIARLQHYGLDGNEYIKDYFGKVLPYSIKNQGMLDHDFALLFPDGIPKHVEHFPQHMRSGMLPNYEIDPRVVTAQYFKALSFAEHFEKPYQQISKMVNMTVEKLPKEQKVRLLANSDRKVNPGDTVLPKPVVDAMNEYLSTIRGSGVASVQAVQSTIRQFWAKLGIKVPERVGTVFLDNMLATMYGAAMGARPMLLARNHMQTTWNLYPRLGQRMFSKSMEDAITPDKVAEAMDALAIRSPQGGLPLYDALYEEMAEVGVQGTGHFSKAVAWAWNKGAAKGLHRLKKVSEKTLIPYGNTDTFGRVWAYHYQKRHTNYWLERLESGSISDAKFYEEGLPMYGKAVRDEFAARLRYQGRENALQFIGKMASDETHFVYQLGNHPSWMQHPFGRFFGMFGTWSLNQKELYAQMWRNGTVKQRTAAGMRMGSIFGALSLVGYSLGVNMNAWMAPKFYTWTGGPGVDWAIGLKDVIDAPDMEQRTSAMQRLAANLPRLALPGQVLFNDVVTALEATDDPVLQAFYMALGRPKERDFMDVEFEYHPPTPTSGATTGINPATSLAPTPIPDFTINQESMGLGPQVSGGSVSIQRTTPNLEILELLGGNVRQ